MHSKNPHYTARNTTRWTDRTIDLNIVPRDLSIVWGNDTRYWQIHPSKVDVPAELVQVNWLEVTGNAILTPGKMYKIGFTVSLSDDAFGWNNVQVYAMAKLGKRGNYVHRKVSVTKSASNNNKFDIPSMNDSLKIQIPHNSKENTVYFGLYEVWSGRWKGGLRIHSAFIREI